MGMLLKYESLILDSEERIMRTLTSNLDIRFKVVELYNELIGGKNGEPVLVDSTPPDVGLALGLNGIMTLYNTLVFRLNANPENLPNHVWSHGRRDGGEKAGTLYLKDIAKMQEYHQRKRCYYDIIYYLDVILADYKITDTDIADIMDLNMDDNNKLRLIVLRRFYDRQENGLDAELKPLKVVEMQQRLANLIGQSTTCANYNPREVKAYLRALELVIQWVSCYRRRDEENEI